VRITIIIRLLKAENKVVSDSPKMAPSTNKLVSSLSGLHQMVI